MRRRIPALAEGAPVVAALLFHGLEAERLPLVGAALLALVSGGWRGWRPPMGRRWLVAVGVVGLALHGPVEGLHRRQAAQTIVVGRKVLLPEPGQEAGQALEFRAGPAGALLGKKPRTMPAPSRGGTGIRLKNPRIRFSR